MSSFRYRAIALIALVLLLLGAVLVQVAPARADSPQVVAVGTDSYYDFGQCNVSGWTGISLIAAGDFHTLGLKPDGSVIAVGWNNTGDCEVSGWSDIVQVVAGNYHTVGLKGDGTVVAVGYDGYGQCDVSDWHDIVDIAAGHWHTLGLKADGSVLAKGANHFGQCAVSDWSDVVQASGGDIHSVGLKSDGTVVATGDNSYGQCAVSGWSDVVQVAAGSFHTVGLKADGTVVATGDNSYGECDVSGWSDIVQVVGGQWHTVGLKADGTVVAVGDDTYHQCDVSGWSCISQIAAGELHTVGLRNLDTTPPVITVTSPGAGAAYTQGQTVAPVWTASDAGSGVDWSKTSATPLDTSTPGAHTFVVTATDLAGNVAQASVSYSVYATTALSQPVNPDGSSIFRLGRTVPLKFSLADAQGAPVFGLAPKLHVSQLSGGIWGSDIEAASTSAADVGNTFRELSPGSYLFNLSTTGLSTGTWRLRIDLGNGAQLTGQFSLR